MSDNDWVTAGCLCHANNRRWSTVAGGRYEEFLREIGYLLPEGEDFQISTENVDPVTPAAAPPPPPTPPRRVCP